MIALWRLPGDGVEVGETLERAAMREVLEETGLQVALEGVIDLSEVLHPTHHSLHVCFRGRVVGGALRPEPKRPTHLPGWFDQSEPEGLTLRCPHYRRVLLAETPGLK